MGFQWTADADAVLRTLWGNASTRAIAERINAEFNVNVSRSAVGGRAKRLGLQRLVAHECAAQKKQAHTRRRHPANFNLLRLGPTLTPSYLPSAVATDAPPEKRMGLLDPRFDRDSCHFFLGDVGEPGAGFCPEKAVDGPYCLEHRLRIIQPR